MPTYNILKYNFNKINLLWSSYYNNYKNKSNIITLNTLLNNYYKLNNLWKNYYIKHQKKHIQNKLFLLKKKYKNKYKNK